MWLLSAFSFATLAIGSLPATADGLVERDLVAELRQTGSDQPLFGAEQRTLGIEPGKIAVHPLLVAYLRQLEVGLTRLHQLLLGLQLLLIVSLGAERIRHFLEGGLDALLVARHRLLGAHLGYVQIRDALATVKDRQIDLRHEGPGTGATVKQPAQLVAGGARRRGQRDGREEGRTGGADIGIGRFQAVLGRQDVRALLQQAGGGTHRDGRQLHLGQGRRLGHQCGNTSPEQQRQAIAILLHLSLVLGQAHLGALQRGTALGQLHLGGGPQPVFVLSQAIALLLGGQGRLAQRQQLLIRQQGEIGVGHRGHQGDLGAALGLDLRQIGLQRLIFEALDPAEQVQLVGGDADVGAVLAADGALPRAAEIVRSLLARARAIGRQGRQLGRPLDPVSGLVGLHVEGRDTQIPVVLEGRGDQLLQGGIEELLAPGGDGRLPRLVALPGGALWQLGALVIGGHGTAPQQQSHAQGDQGLSHV